MGLLDLVKQSRTVKLSGGEVEVFAMRWREILQVLARNNDMLGRIRDIPKDELADQIRDAVLGAGEAALNDMFDAATASERGAAAQANLTAADENDIILTVLELSLPRDRLGKQIAEGERWLGVFGQE